jgi:hypothetical protein
MREDQQRSAWRSGRCLMRAKMMIGPASETITSLWTLDLGGGLSSWFLDAHCERLALRTHHRLEKFLACEIDRHGLRLRHRSRRKRSITSARRGTYDSFKPKPSPPLEGGLYKDPCVSSFRVGVRTAKVAVCTHA